MRNLTITSGIHKIDLHRKSVEQVSSLIDKLSTQGSVVELVTGHGVGSLKKVVTGLKNIYGYKILSTSANGASFVIDFS